MVYYRVLANIDNKPRFKYKRGGGLEIDGFFVAGELYTPREKAKYCEHLANFERVEIPKSKIYFFFGARFAVGGEK